MIELLLFILATSAFIFWLGEQREGAALGGAATGFAAIVAIIFIIYILNQLK